MKNEQAAIFMFHSILHTTDVGYGKDKWFNNINMFEEICKTCANSKDVKVITNKQLLTIEKDK